MCIRSALELGDLDAMPADVRGAGFDAIALLNVLDRCDHPLTLLQQLRALLRDDRSTIVLATPLPFLPSVEDGRKWRKRACLACRRPSE